ncbi:hypothetical protein F4860DRAFT_48228 [Xylaria cubensis]|nr:hypothetical protein F4860DRAFT_48228 [Xylaria cubensis]
MESLAVTDRRPLVILLGLACHTLHVIDCHEILPMPLSCAASDIPADVEKQRVRHVQNGQENTDAKSRCQQHQICTANIFADADTPYGFFLE